jgi:hypothetical protein
VEGGCVGRRCELPRAAIGCWAVAYYLLGWESSPALLAGIALAATSVAVVYTVMMEYGFNRTDFGRPFSPPVSSPISARS